MREENSGGDLDLAGPPNCPRCLVAMEAVGEGAALHWSCPDCGLASF